MFRFIITCILIGSSILATSAFVIDEYSMTLYWIGLVIIFIGLIPFNFFLFRLFNFLAGWIKAQLKKK